jgi:hypothetical protein
MEGINVEIRLLIIIILFGLWRKIRRVEERIYISCLVRGFSSGKLYKSMMNGDYALIFH